MVPPVKSILILLSFCMLELTWSTYSTFGSVLLPPSQVNPRRSLAVVALRLLSAGAARTQARNSTDAKDKKSISIHQLTVDRGTKTKHRRSFEGVLYSQLTPL